jgi:two-component system, sensor histidine kinase PdtaS
MKNKYLLLNFICSITLSSFSQNLIDSLRNELKKQHHDSVKCKILLHLSEISGKDEWPIFNQRLLDLTTKNLKTHQSKKAKKFYLKHQAIAFNNKGYLLQYEGEFDEAKQLYQRSIEINESISELRNLAENYANMGFLHKQSGDIIHAITFYELALSIENKINDKEGKSLTLNNIASIYYTQGDVKKAKEIFNIALNLKKEIADEIGAAKININLAAIYRSEKDYISAKKMLDNSLEIFLKAEDNYNVSITLNHLGNIYLEINDIDKGLHYFHKSLAIKEEIGDKHGLASLYKNIGDCYFKLSDVKNAEKYGLLSLNLALEIGVVEVQKESSFLLFKVYKKLNNFKKALDMHEIFTKMKDSTFNEATQKDAIRLQYKFEYDTKNLADSLNYEKERELRRIEIKTSKNKQYVFALFSFLVLLFSLILYRRFKKEKIQNKIIQNQKIELELLIKEVHHRVKNNLQIISSLLNMQGENSSNEQVQNILQQSQNRIQAMALIHEKLYQSGNLKDILIDEYLENLVEFFRSSYDLMHKKIEIKLNSPKVFIEPEQLIPLGLIVNECILNSIKYAFEENQGGVINIEVFVKGEKFLIIFEDNGKGLPSDWKEKSLNSLGMNLINGLTRQLKGKCEIDGANGTKISIEFNLTHIN